MLLELGNVTTYGFPSQGQAKFLLKKLAEHADIAAFLRDQSEPVRAQIDSNDVHYNPASLTTNVYKVFTGIREQMMYSTNFYIGKQRAAPTRWKSSPVVAGSRFTGIQMLSRAPGPRMRRWPSRARIGWGLRWSRRRSIRAGAKQVRRTGTRFRGGASIRAGVPEGQPEVPRDGDADTYFPGWVATVDGQPAPVYEAYGFLRGVVVEAGAHRIEMRYRPKSVYWGARR